MVANLVFVMDKRWVDKLDDWTVELTVELTVLQSVATLVGC
jgi:hypothetical protein